MIDKMLTMRRQEKLYTLITGASTGLGRELAIQCAMRNRNLILVALPGRDLESLADDLMAMYAVEVKYFEMDLTQDQSIYQLVEAIKSDLNIDMLINNAGIGGTANLTESSVNEIDSIIQLNIRATSLLSRLLIPELLKHSRSFIMNISSIAAFTPIAYKTVYPASKAFIYSFSLGLNEEFSSKGLSVSVVHPGPILTNFNTTKRIIAQGFKAKLGLLNTASIAELSLKQCLAGKTVIVPGFWNRLNLMLMRLMPLKLACRVSSNIVKTELAAPLWTSAT